MRAMRTIGGISALAMLVAVASPAVAAGDPVNGKTLFTNNCSSCHTLRDNLGLARLGANDPVAIQNAISTVTPMSFLKGKFSAADLADIAAYIGTVVAGGGGGGGAVNYQGLWWASAGNEAYWGVNFVHQGDQIFGTWYTYDTTGRPWWLSMLVNRTAPGSNAYTGPIYADTGPPFNAFVGAGKPTQIGTATLTFADANNGTFAYTVNTAAAATKGMAIAAAVAQQKSITRFDLGTGPQPTCTYTAAAPNYAARRTTRTSGGSATAANRAGGSTSRTRATASSPPGTPTTSTARRCGCRCSRRAWATPTSTPARSTARPVRGSTPTTRRGRCWCRWAPRR